MTYRGVYRDGVVILQGEVDLQDGVSVEVNATPLGNAKSSRVSKVAVKLKPAARKGHVKKTPRTAKTSEPALPGTGIWKDRWPKSMSSAEVARKLREEVSRRTR